MSKRIILGWVVLLLTVGVFVYKYNVFPASKKAVSFQNMDTKPALVSTSPVDLSPNSSILPAQQIQLNFNLPLENIGEFKYKITPVVELNAMLSGDRKTVTITPKLPYPLGKSFEIEVLPDSKFNPDPANKSTQQRLENSIFVKFKTIDYRGV